MLGPNGAGKTTAISIVAGILEADAGQVRIDGQLVAPSETRVRRFIGYVPQELAISPDLTGRENLLFRPPLRCSQWRAPRPE
ncbi:MAG TPA: ATP-binding cassette domain-containing protein [Actinomycetota bacterium]|nr:ATP-binding cassette domain-containing protein [Actinomycetota bacterium]